MSKTDGSRLDILFWLRNTDCILVRLSWIKIDVPDIINCDIWIRNCMLKNNCQCLYSIDTNSEGSYQSWLIKKCKLLKTVIQ